MSAYLPSGLAVPVPSPDELSKPYWEATRAGKLVIQRCNACGAFQWGPEWICHECHSFDVGWEEVQGRGRIFSWERPHYSVHPALNGHGPYVVVLVELPAVGSVRMVGNLLGNSVQEVVIGTEVEAVFEPHDDGDPPYTLVQWRLATLG